MTAAPVIDERLHRDALEALVAGPLNGKAYDYDGTPTTLPNIFTLLSIERRYVPPRTGSGLSGRSGWRVAFRYVGRTVDEARWAGLKIAQALDQQRLSVGGFTSTPITHESTAAIESDDGRFSGLAVYTYAL